MEYFLEPLRKRWNLVRNKCGSLVSLSVPKETTTMNPMEHAMLSSITLFWKYVINAPDAFNFYVIKERTKSVLSIQWSEK